MSILITLAIAATATPATTVAVGPRAVLSAARAEILVAERASVPSANPARRMLRIERWNGQELLIEFQ